MRRSLAWARIALGQADGALAPLEEALVEHRAEGNVRGEADALAARGLLQRLRGNIEAAHRDLENAYALHVMSGDAIRREKVREMAQMLGLVLAPEDEEGTASERIARLTASADAHHASGRTWREAIARLQLAQLESCCGCWQAAARWPRSRRPRARPPTPQRRRTRIGGATSPRRRCSRRRPSRRYPLLNLPRAARAQSEDDDSDEGDGSADADRGGDDARSAATRAHQARLRETWLGVGAACFRRWLAAYEDEASPAELAGAARERSVTRTAGQRW